MAVFRRLDSDGNVIGEPVEVEVVGWLFDADDVPPVTCPPAQPVSVTWSGFGTGADEAPVDPDAGDGQLWESMRTRDDLLTISDDGTKPGSPAHRRRSRDWLERENRHRERTGQKRADTAAQRRLRNETTPRLSEAQLAADRLIDDMMRLTDFDDLETGDDGGLWPERIPQFNAPRGGITISWNASGVATTTWGSYQAELAERCRRLGYAFRDIQEVAVRAGMAVGELVGRLEQQARYMVTSTSIGPIDDPAWGGPRPGPNRAARRAKPMTGLKGPRPTCHHGNLKGSCRACWKEQR